MSRLGGGWAALAVGLLVVLAGCSGVFGGEGDDRATFDVPVQYPPGVNESGSVDAYDVLSSHADEVEESSVTVRHEVVQRFDDGTLRYRVERTARYRGTNRSVVRRVDGQFLPPRERGTRVELWSNGTAAVRAIARNGTTTYTAVPAARALRRSGFDRLFDLFVALDPQFAERRVVDGTTVFVLRATIGGSVSEAVLGHAAAARSLTDPRNASFTVLVERDGVVASYDLAYTATAGNRTVRVVESRRVEDLGTTTVPRPAWVETAVAQACDRSVDVRPEWCAER